MSERDRQLVTIGERKYTVELGAYKRQTVDMTRQMVDQAAESSDATLTNVGIWKRTIQNFSGGSGQRWADLVDESVRSQARRSYNLMPFQRRRLRLTAPAELRRSCSDVVRAYTCADDRIFWGPDNGAQVCTDLVDGATAYVPTNPTGAAITGTVNDMAAFNGKLYVGTTTGTWVVDIATWVVAAGPLEATGVRALEFAAGRLVATSSVDGEWFEISASGTKTNIMNHWWDTSSPWQFKGIASLANGVYAASNPTGGPSEIYFATVDDATGGFANPRLAMRMPDEERINSMAAGPGLLLLGTSKGARIAVPGADGSLTLGPLFFYSEPVNTAQLELVTTGKCMVTSVACAGGRGFMQVAVDPMFLYERSSSTKYTMIVAVDFSTFTSELAPAWQAIARPDADDEYWGYGLIANGNTDWGGSPKDYLISFMNDVDGGNSHIFAIDRAVMPTSGEWWSGQYTFGTPERKRYTSVDIETDRMPEGCRVEAWASCPSEFERAIGDLSTEDATSVRWTISPPMDGDWLEVHLKLKPSAAGTTSGLSPHVNRITVRAMPLPYRIEEIFLPVILHENVTAPDGGQVGFDVWDDFEYLRDLLTSREPVTVRMGSESMTAYVDGLFMDGADPNTRISGWNTDRTWINGVVVVKFLTLETNVEDEQAIIEMTWETEDGEVVLTEDGTSILTES